MFDFRYHVASLAAVFFALVIGILVGVALASHGLGNAERKKLEAELGSARSRIDDLKGALQADKAETQFASVAYDAVMADRLRGKRIAVLFIGPANNTIQKAIGATLDDTGATMTRLRAISVPLKVSAIDGALTKRTGLVSYAVGRKRFSNIGGELASEFVAGGDMPLWNALEEELVEVRIGGSTRPVDGVVLVRTAKPQTRRASAQLVTGLFSGFGGSGVPVVGVELRGTFPSAVKTYKHFDISSVDDLDLAVGRVALAVLLSPEGISGHYGLQDVDDAILPQIPPVATVTTGG